MRKHLLGLLAILLISSISNSLSANDYKKHANEIRNAVWNWDIEAFRNYSIPEEHQNESAIVLARHQQIEATSKNKFRINALLYADINRELYYTNIDRIMIKLNDKKALDEYSELSFKEEVKSWGHFRSNKLKTVIGARIIKPDGSILEINIDDDAVAITEGKKDKEAFKKIAIKGLETGDILDYFYSEEMELETLNVPPQTFRFFSNYPTLSYSVECVLGQKLTVEYRSINGAPDFEQSVDDDKNTVLKASKRNLKTVDGINDIRWLSAYRDLPMLRLVILNNSSKLTYKTANARKNGIYKDVDYEEILKDKKGYFAIWSNKLYWRGNDMPKKVSKAMENYKQKNPSASDEELALYAYDALRFYCRNNARNYPYPMFFMTLEKVLKENDIKSRICFTTNRFGARKDEVVEEDDLSVFLTTNNNKQLFFFPNGYKYAGEIVPTVEGEVASTIFVASYKPKSPEGIEGATGELEIPTSSFEDNKSIVKSQIIFSEQNPLELQITRTTASSGNMKENYQDMFVLYEDWDKVMRERLWIETDFWQDLAADKDTRQYIDQYKALFEENRKEQKELMQAELKEYHSTNSGELITYSINSIGATVDKPTFEFETQYTMDGLVRKAGDNLILDAGKLIGTQWEPTEKERKRDWDAYIPAPICIENEISVQIPENYTIEGIENLNKHINNMYGQFTSSAVIEGNQLIITTRKIYKRNYVPKQDWNSFLDMLDTTNDFCSQSVILLKTQE